jgi:hypothetical protein
MSSTTPVPLTRVEQTYQQLRNDVPQLEHLPSVIIQLIAEYGPPSLWIVYMFNGTCHVLYPAPVIETISARTSGEVTSSDRKRSPARTRPILTAMLLMPHLQYRRNLWYGVMDGTIVTYPEPSCCI